MRYIHACPECGHLHYPPEQVVLCQCGHSRLTHNDDGGRLKRAYCTVWDTGRTQCPCTDYTPTQE